MILCKSLTTNNTCTFVLISRLDLQKYTRQDQDAKYELFYTFKDAYKLKDMTLKGGITELYKKMENDPETQKLYTYFMSDGLEKGNSGRDVFCSTLTSP